MLVDSIEIKIKIAMAVFFNRITDIPTNWYRSMTSSINNRIRTLLT